MWSINLWDWGAQRLTTTFLSLLFCMSLGRRPRMAWAHSAGRPPQQRQQKEVFREAYDRTIPDKTGPISLFFVGPVQELWDDRLFILLLTFGHRLSSLFFLFLYCGRCPWKVSKNEERFADSLAKRTLSKRSLVNGQTDQQHTDSLFLLYVSQCCWSVNGPLTAKECMV